MTDTNGLSAVTLTVRVDGTDAAGTGAGGTCDAGDYELDPDADEIDANAVDITDSAEDFSETFTVERPGTGSVLYCFFVDADDNALDRNGDAAPNQGAIQTNATIDWQ